MFHFFRKYLGFFGVFVKEIVTFNIGFGFVVFKSIWWHGLKIVLEIFSSSSSSVVVRRPSSVVRRPSSVVRRPSSVIVVVRHRRRPSSVIVVVRRPSSVVVVVVVVRRPSCASCALMFLWHRTVFIRKVNEKEMARRHLEDWTPRSSSQLSLEQAYPHPFSN